MLPSGVVLSKAESWALSEAIYGVEVTLHLLVASWDRNTPATEFGLGSFSSQLNTHDKIKRVLNYRNYTYHFF
jgi:hypothetical protein